MTQEQFIRMCIPNLRHEFIAKGSAVFHFGTSVRSIIGEYGDKFYIILSGVASIVVPKNREIIRKEILHREEIWDALRLKTAGLPPLSEMYCRLDYF